jgi:hypothetical protein
LESSEIHLLFTFNWWILPAKSDISGFIYGLLRFGCMLLN